MVSQVDFAIIRDEETGLTMLDAIWQQIQQGLEAEKARIVGEIGNYPRPITACDAQFNGLLEDRVSILQELGQIQELLRHERTASEQLGLLHDFMLSSRYRDSEVEGKIQELTTKLSGAS
jgi:hypothetical protein